MALILGRSSTKKDDKEQKGGAIPLRLNGGPGDGPQPFGRKLGGKGTSLLDLIKQFYRKDMAVITSALGVLFLAPIAEHFISGPSDSRVIQPGFDSKDNPFGGGSPFEPGAGGNAPGGVSWGANQSRITPLNARDPGYLIIPDRDGEGGPATAQVAPPGQEAKDQGWKDVVKEHAREGAKAAFGAAGNPRVKSALTTALKSMAGGGDKGGGSSASASNVSLAPPAKSVLSKGGSDSSSHMIAAAPGYKGVSMRGANQISGSIDSLRAAGGGNSLLNRGGIIVPGGGTTANDTMHGGGGGAGGGGMGGNTPATEAAKGGGPNSKENKPEQKESLAYLRTKMEMEKSIDLKWKKKEWDEFGRAKMHEEENTKGGWQLKAAQVQANAQIQAAAIQAAGTIAAAAVKEMGKFMGSDKNGKNKPSENENPSNPCQVDPGSDECSDWKEENGQT
ncbi:MAG: hypothetical protein HY059_09935 [Proteobacteria bacterium]|nr:hypothetical protein [Pseudomonadota bacterium]